VSRRRGVALVVITALVTAFAAEWLTDESRAADTQPARLQVSAHEFRYTLSRTQIRAGHVIVQLVNYGEDDHNLRLRRRGVKYVHRIGRTAPDEMSELRTRLHAGTFKLWCSLPGHAAAGMKATLRVVRPKK
jgi:plastocyanin